MLVDAKNGTIIQFQTRKNELLVIEVRINMAIINANNNI